MIFMLRLENSLLCKQNGITSQIVYYHFEDRVLYFKRGSLVAARAFSLSLPYALCERKIFIRSGRGLCKILL